MRKDVNILIAGPPDVPAVNEARPPVPPLPMIKPLFTSVSVSPAERPPFIVKAGTLVESDQTYTPELTCMTTSVIPAT
jgi:hypothetical protein